MTDPVHIYHSSSSNEAGVRNRSRSSVTLNSIGGENNNSEVYPQVESEVLGHIMTQSNIVYRSNASLNSSVTSIAETEQHYIPSIANRQSSQEARAPDDSQSILSKVLTAAMPNLKQSKTSYWSPRLQDKRHQVVLRFLLTNMVLICFILTIFVLFWGATYNTAHYYYRTKILAVIQDDIVSPDASILPMTAIFPALIAQLPGTWHVFNTSSFQDKYNVKSTEEINAKIISLVYDEKYFISFNVQPNVTERLYDSLTTNDSPAFNSTDLFESVYESGRDPINIKSFMLPLITSLQTSFQEYYTNTYLPGFLSNITLPTPVNSTKLSFATIMKFNFLDYRPFYDRILYGPAQVGAIYTMTLTVFQFLIYGPVHARMARILKPRHALIYRWSITCFTAFILSLFICTISAIYHVDFTLAFGKAGFIVYWMSTWLFMFAVAGANENVIGLIFLYRPQFTGIWVLSFVILNLAPTLFTMALDSPFYRYGYMMPLHNAVDIYRVIFLNVSKRKMGRNYGVLCAWIVLNGCLSIFILKYIRKVVERREAAMSTK
ncbi:hypothetical protein KAFR_0C06258 [Kazachstania africana CBS 2517]|uniref:DUF3533 domain-containing protein n=1 Tax=Kazachstania africana (strain ATCC 22294 / BCRC 22015 / CBS 2517 / CECT 1963 / NBRC 1671 / NRRL Y-8276) TaxID=1071382 RepID=H2ATC0_KAZAF|nr:hypothetical protein KAFR_0C06258 [Kazachstania africana CBS 2517]CCF57620.1 hypothetical protein KAFR_0C06258 [Kazachstania africana CBS 2517]